MLISYVDDCYWHTRHLPYCVYGFCCPRVLLCFAIIVFIAIPTANTFAVTAAISLTVAITPAIASSG